MNEKPNLFIRWRWAITASSALMLWSAARHTVLHDVAGFGWPNGFTLPILWLSALSITFLAVMAWVATFYRRRVAGAEPPSA